MSTHERLSNRPRSISTLQLIYDDHKSNGYSAVLWNSFTHKYGFEESAKIAVLIVIMNIPLTH